MTRYGPQNMVDVLIVGAGPTGLTLACELARRGVSYRIIDKAQAPATTSRALGLHSRTMEVFQNMGIIDQVLAAGKGVRAIGAQLHEGNAPIATITLQRTDQEKWRGVPYPFVMIIPQSTTEGILRQHLYRLGGTIEYAKTLIAIRQEPEYVIVTTGNVDDSQQREEIYARWLVGCDGAHSQVRKALGIPFVGSTYPETLLLADVDMDWIRERDRTHSWLHRDGLLAAFPPPEGRQWRLFVDITTLIEPQQQPEITLELLQSLFSERTSDTHTTISNPTWISLFRINRRMVQTYRRGRAFLAGDAAHIHSPFGGQGMNLGIQDAFNLAWKLALVIHGEAPLSLLDTYEEERKPVARHVLQDTHSNTRVLISHHPLVRWLRNHILIPLLANNMLRLSRARRTSGIGVNYRRASLAHNHEPFRLMHLADWFSFWRGPRAGDRAPEGTCLRAADQSATSLFAELRTGRFSLLLFTGLHTTEDSMTAIAEVARQCKTLWGEQLHLSIIASGETLPESLAWDGPILLDTTHTLHQLYGARGAALYLVRPDGYIAFRSQPITAEPLREYLHGLLRPAQQRLLQSSAAR